MATKMRSERPPRSSKTRPLKKRAGAARKDIVKTAAPDMVQAALAAFAHEVRTPLTGILALSDLLATSDLGERERRWADSIKAGAEHLAGLTTLFVDAAKTARGIGGERQDLFDLRALARAAGDSLAGRAAAKGLQAQVEISEKAPTLVVGDPVRVRAALENLIDNAVKFTEHGGVALSVEPWCPVRGKSEGKSAGKSAAKSEAKSKGEAGHKVGVAFVVSDSGIGVTLSEIKRLFRPFSQANVTIASRFGGAGLGLSSVRQLARAMGGDITVGPRPEGGATFTLTMSLNPAGIEKLPESGADDREPDDVGSLRVLSVADNPFGRVVLNAILTELGHQAEFTGRGEDALDRLSQGTFDAVLMDMVLPGIDGIEAIKRIRAMRPPQGCIPIIGVSGRGEDEAASRAAGADAFLVKPVSPRALSTALLEVRRRAEAGT